MPAERLPTVASIMVPVDLGPAAQDRVKMAASIADKFSSRLIGIAADEPALEYYMEGDIATDNRTMGVEHFNLAEDLVAAESLFRKAAGDRKDIEWRQGREMPIDFIVEQSRASDLVVVTRRNTTEAGRARLMADLGDLVMGLGRPILIIPPRTTYLSAQRIVIAWKNTREARRAVTDSLPFLKRAEDVVVTAIGVDAKQQDTADVCTHLNRHGIPSRPLIRDIIDDSVSRELISIAADEGADLIVCGAYGHSRMHEWIFGGVTRSLINTTSIPCLMSH